jgi:hypothetical protein
MAIVHIPVEFPDSAKPEEIRRIAKAVHEHGQKLVAKGRPEPKAPKAQKSASALGAKDEKAETIADNLKEMLTNADPKTADEAENEKIYQAIIALRKIERDLSPETRSVLSRAIAKYSNARQGKTPTKRK